MREELGDPKQQNSLFWLALKLGWLNDFKRFDNCYEVIWKCAQSMPYPAFYQVWHQKEKVKYGE
ncbi:hypothetical protein [Nostoc sp.]